MLGMQGPGVEATAGDSMLATAIVIGMLTALAASVVVAGRLARRLGRGLPVIEPRPHPAAAWRGADVALIALAYLGLLVAAGTIVSDTSPLRVLLLADVASKSLATIVGMGLLASGGASWAALGFAGGRWRDDVRIAACGLALVLAPLLAIAALLDRIVSYRHSIVTFLQGHRDPIDVGLVVLAAVVVAPVAEEFFFRRVLQGWLEARLPEADGAAAIGLSAAAFAAAHLGQGLAPAPLFLLGIVLGVIAHRTGSIIPCILLHAAFNAVGVALLLADPAGAAAAG